MPTFTLLMSAVLLCLNPVLCHGQHSSQHSGQHSGHHSGHQHVSRSQQANEDVFHDKKVSGDAEHIKEHYEGQLNFNETEMSPEELEFHYFKQHDFDNNTKLDGLEIYKALTDIIPYNSEELEKIRDPSERRTRQEKYYSDIVDAVLKEDDLDNDGYLTYVEYVVARRRGEAQQQQQKYKDNKEL